MNTWDIDSALKAITREFRHVTDHVLDLREAALTKSDPGLCVQCYFKIYGHSARRSTKPLLPLRQWLERHVVVVARDHASTELERLPISLNKDSLEDFCTEMMTEFRENRVYHHTPNIELTFQFNDSVAA